MKPEVKRIYEVPEDTMFLILGVLRLEKDGIKNPASNIEIAMKELKACTSHDTPAPASEPEPPIKSTGNHDRAIQKGEGIRWATALNTLIATESKRPTKDSVDMVFSFRIAQIIESLRCQATASKDKGDEE